MSEAEKPLTPKEPKKPFAPIGEEGWKKLDGAWAKAKTQVQANWTHEKASTFGKVSRVAGAGVGVIIVGSGLKNLGQAVGVFSPPVDETGKEKDISTGSSIVKGLAKLGAGAAVVWASLIAGGKGKALGVVPGK